VIIEAMRGQLRNDSGISAISTAIYPHHIPQGVSYPAVTFGVDGDDNALLLDGISSLKEALFSVDCWDYSVITANRLADAVEAALVGARGDFGGLSPSQEVDHVRKERRFDLYEPDTKLYRVSLQFFVAYY
jgi:Protein of unknown function (DUF3168)